MINGIPRWQGSLTAALIIAVATGGCRQKVEPEAPVAVQATPSTTVRTESRNEDYRGLQDWKNAKPPSLRPHELTAHDALATLAAIRDSDQRVAMARDIAAALQEAGLRSFTQELSTLSPDEGRDQLLAAVLRELVKTDPAGAMQICLDLDDGQPSEALVKKVAQVWAGRDFLSLHDFAQAMRPSKYRTRLEVEAVWVWTRQDAMGAFTELAKLDLRHGGDTIHMPAQWMADRDSEAAIQALDLIGPRDTWAHAASRIFTVIAQNDPAAAEKWFFEQDDPQVGTAFGAALGWSLARKSLPDVVRVLNEIKDYTLADHFIHGAIHELCSEPRALDQLLPYIEQIEDTRFREITADSSARGVAEYSPETAIAWANSLPESETKARAFQGIGGSYAVTDSDRAQSWLNTLPPGKDRRYAVYGFAWEIMQKKPEVAASWALTIPDSDGYAQLVKGVLRHWTISDPAAAQTWAANHHHTEHLPDTRAAP